MADLAIIDGHHHLWDLENNPYSWLTGDEHYMALLGDYGPMCKSYLIEDLLDDIKNQNVVKSVHLQANWDADPVAESRWLQGVADKHGFPHGIMAGAQMHDPDLEAQLDGHSEYANVRGVRHMVNWHDTDEGNRFTDRGDYLTDSAWRAGLKALRKHNFVFDLGVMYNQLAEAADAMATIPDTTVVLNHIGFPIKRDEAELARWRTELATFAKVPNTTVKLSGFVMFDNNWTVDSLRPMILHTIDCFGPSRCMFTSNFPVDKLFATYDDLFYAYKEVVKDFSEAEQRQLFHDTAERVYRL